MAEIRLLTKEVRDLIAAGEVVERPASVVKELVENAIDAGGDVIEVEIRRSGLELIRVTDNGCGIARDEVQAAFLRHATSKVRQAGDLEQISTLGFRGEALAAIASVSSVRLVTKTQDAQHATEYTAEAGEETGLGDTGAPGGTSVYVCDLFFNTPARMKFLKKDVYEGNAVATITEQLALSHPEIAFRFVRDGKAVFSTPGDGDLFSAVFSLFPRDVTADMIQVTPLDERVRVWGYLSAPQKARASRSLQYVFVNGRFIKSRSVAAAAEEACKNLIMQGKHPSFVLNIALPEQDVDVNVHPAKTEVRFKNDRDVFSAVYAAVKLAVTQYAGDFQRQTAPDPQPQDPPTPLAPGAQEAPPDERPAGQPRSFLAFVPDTTEQKRQTQTTLEQAASVYDTTKYRKLDIEYERPVPRQPETWTASGDIAEEEPACEIRVLGELFGTYIVAQYGDTALFIDKHAAHERILFDRLEKSGEEAPARQILLEPVIVVLSRDEKQALLEGSETLARIGFLADDFGETEVAVREAPTYLSLRGVAGAVTEIARKMAAQSSDITARELEWLLHSAACRAAIQAGHKTSIQEMTRLAADILTGTAPKYCPHGRPVYFSMDKREMEKRFGRIQ